MYILPFKQLFCTSIAIKFSVPSHELLELDGGVGQGE